MPEITEDQITPRHLFSLVLLHAEIVANQAPAAVIESFQRDQLIDGAVDMTDRLLEKLARPAEPEPLPPHLTYDAWTTQTAQHAAIRRIAQQADFAELPEFLRNFITLATASITKAESGIPF